MNPTISKYLFFYPVRYLRGEYLKKCLQVVKVVEKFSERELKSYQINKLNRILLAYQKSVETTSKKHINLDDSNPSTNGFESLMDLPLLNKEDIQRNYKELTFDTNQRISLRSTSGSTGTPLKFYKDRDATAFMDAVMYHSYSWHGINIGDRQARFWGMPYNLKKNYTEKLKDLLMNRIRFSAFDITEEKMSQYYYRIKKFKPAYIYGYPSLIYEFICFLKRNSLDIRFLDLKALIVTGEIVSPYQLEVIKGELNVPIVNEYGCTEVGIIAFQCTMGMMHVMSHNIILEVIKSGRQVIDEEGDVVITELNAKIMPFVRYKIGDRAILKSEKCNCGLAFPVIEILEGRKDDYIITPDGKKVYDAIFAYTFKKGIKKFKAIQKKLDLIDVYIVKDENYDEQLEKHYIQKLRENINPNIDFNFIYTSELNHEKSGKFKYFVSEVNKNLS